MKKVGIIMGSTSDLPVMQDAIDVLKGFDIEVEVDIVSAHRTPDKLFDYGKNAHNRGIGVIVAGAGCAAGAGDVADCRKLKDDEAGAGDASTGGAGVPPFSAGLAGAGAVEAVMNSS